MQDYKKPLIIGASVAAVAFLGLFLKNYIQESRFKPLARDEFVKIYKQLRKENFISLKQISIVASQLASQFKQITPQMIKGYLSGPESPIKIDEMFEKNIEKICQANNITCNQKIIAAPQFNLNMNHYKEDGEVKQLLNLSEKEFEVALTGRVPAFPVQVPEFLTKQKVLEIQAKVVKQKYLFQIGIFRKLRKYTQQQLAENPELMKGLPNPETQQQMLQEQGLGGNDQPASAVLHAALLKYRGDEVFKHALQSIDNSFRNIYARYETKINNNKISEIELTELEDEIIYFQYV